jgi:hypothetical protein
MAGRPYSVMAQVRGLRHRRIHSFPKNRVSPHPHQIIAQTDPLRLIYDLINMELVVGLLCGNPFTFFEFLE